MLRRLQTGICIFQHLLKCCVVMRLHMTIKIILAGVYTAEMFLLPETAPEVNTKLQEGEHVVKRSENTYFNTVWSDLELDQLVVKDSKSR